MKKPDLSMAAFAVQLYTADKYNFSAADTALVFTECLADTIAYALKPGGNLDALVDALVAELRRRAEWRLANPNAMGLREIIAEYKRCGGKVRVS